MFRSKRRCLDIIRKSLCSNLAGKLRGILVGVK
jgi:hypothetical protein